MPLNLPPLLDCASVPGVLPLIEALRVGGRPGRKLAARADLLRSTGLRHVARRVRQPGRVARLAELRRGLYDEIWREAAAEVGAEVADLSDGFLELRRGELSTRVRDRLTTLDDAVTLELALDKELVTRLLRDAGLPVPEQVSMHYHSPRLPGDGAYVVKPASGTGGGEGTTCGVRTESELRRAVLRASRSGDRVVVERQAPGDVYRLLFLDGELLDVVRRGRPRLVGDGRSTVDELIEAENRRRVDSGGRAGLEVLVVDLDCVFTLGRGGLGLSGVPRAGELVEVKTVTNENRAEDNETVPAAEVGEELVAEARAAVAAVGLRLAGVDVVTPDAGRSLAEAGGVIIEVNGGPGLHHHYLVKEPAAATRVAVPIVRLLLGAP